VSRRYVIVGNGVAGMSAAERLRQRDPEARITLVSDESQPYYYRASLSEWIAGETDCSSLYGRTRAFYDQMRLEAVWSRVGRAVPDRQRAILDDGSELPYDALLLATGAQPIRLEIPGLRESLAFRTWADARAIRERLGCCGSALIVGGGVLGLELAGALHRMGIASIAVVQRDAYVGRPLLDEAASEFVMQRMVADGIALYLHDTLQRVEGKRAIMDSGQRREFDILVQAIGVRATIPDVPELAVGRAVRIDAAGRTNLPRVFAAGDCTETYDTTSEAWRPTRTWLASAEQGVAAADAMLGYPGPDAHPVFYNLSLIYTIPYAYIGDPHGAGGQVVLWESDKARRKVRLVGGQLAGALLVGDRRGSQAMLAAIGKPVCGEDLAAPTWDWNAFGGQNWDHVLY